MTQPKIWLSSPHMGGDELKFIQEAFDTNWISPVGPHISGFEEDLSRYVGVAHGAALSSGTAAIHLALIILGVQKEDEVLCSSFTFSGTCNPIVYQGAKPVFIDSEASTWNMDPELLEEAIKDRIRKTGKKPKAVIVVHLYGMPAQMDKIMKICRAYEIPVIEDAAEALGSNLHGQKLGTFGDLSVLSFNGNKIITTSGGGALLSNNKGWIDQAKFLATQARDPAPHYEHSHIGFNYRLSNICAGIGRGQMKVLDERVAQRRKVFEYYQTQLSGIKSIQFLKEPVGYYSNRWLTTILIHPGAGISRETIRLALEKENIESRPLWKPMHLQPVFKHCSAYSTGVSARLFEEGLCLPSGSNLKPEELERLTDLIRSRF
jgi:Predicted pyridoxal phosphate-dependent enzyme apparently involved in regulation of cell wall biogenesis